MVTLNRFTKIGLAILPLFAAVGGSHWTSAAGRGPMVAQTDSAPGASRAFAAPGGLVWIVTNHALDLLKGAAAAELVDGYFNNARTYVIVGTSEMTRLPPKSVPAKTFSSYATLESTLRAGQLDARIKAVIYDCESWSFTPPAEQQNPGKYYDLAATLAHQYHLTFIATPATDLARAGRPKSRAARYDAFVAMRIPAAAAASADLYEIQSQEAVDDVQLFTRFVSGAAGQAKEANPAVIVLAGLSTDLRGREINAGMLFQAVVSTHDAVNGYWLNIPGRGSYCPTCGAPRPDIAAGLLRKLLVYGQGGDPATVR